MFNFKKISAIGASVVMVGMTMGMAAAASFPSPFSSQSASGVAVVTGTGSGADDSVAGGDVATYIASQMGSVGLGSDTVKLERSSDKLNLGNLAGTASGVFVTSVNKDHLGTLLADGTYRDDDNDEFKFTQKVDLSSDLVLSAFKDDDYGDDPAVGIRLTSGATVLTYTLDFTKDPTFSDAKMANTDLPILGKEYFILSVDNTADSMTLLDSAETTTVSEGESVTVTAGGKTYTVTPSIFGSDSVKLDINGAVTPSLKKGDTYKLSDGSYVGVKDLIVQNYQGGQKLAEFSIGAGKLVLTNGQDVELNEETITGLGATVDNQTGKLNKISFTWKTNDVEFVTPTTDLTMPGFGALKVSMTNFVWPSEEVTKVENDGSDGIQLSIPIKDGTATVDLLYASAGALTGLGESATRKLVTTSNPTAGIIYNDSAGDEWFVASWNSTAEAESYYLRVSSVSPVTGSSANKTTLQNVVTGQTAGSCEDKQGGETCTIGNVVLTINTVTTSDKTVNISGSSGVTFNQIYTKEGLKFYLPVTITDNSTSPNKGEIQFDAFGNWTGHNATSWYLFAEGQDKDENLGKVSYNMTVTKNSDNKLHVSNVDVGGGYSSLRVGDTDKYQFYTKSDVVSKIEHDQGPTQQKATITYSGKEAYGEVYLSSTDSSGGGVDAGSLVLKDSEKSTWQNRHVVLVGGSCINSATAEALGVSSGTCEADFTTATSVGDGEYMIKSVGDAFASGKIALVVAGYNKADTAAAAQKLVNDPSAVNTAAGKEYRGKTGVTGSLAFSEVA